MTHLTIEPAWQDILTHDHLDTFETLHSYSGAECCSSHSRGATWRHQLSDGRVIFIKQDYYTKLQPILRAIIHFRWPETNTEREYRQMEIVRSHGFRVPEVVAHSWHPRWLPPTTGVLVEAAVPGVPVDRLVADPSVAEETKRDALAKARKCLTALQDAGFDWNIDCKPEHFFYCEDGEVTILDVERLRFTGKVLSAAYRAKQHDRFTSLLPKEYTEKG